MPVCVRVCDRVHFNESEGFLVSLRDGEVAGALVCG